MTLIITPGEPVDRKRDSAIDRLFDGELTSYLLFSCDNVGRDLECAESGASSGLPGVGELRPDVVSDIIGSVLDRDVQVVTYEPRPSVASTVVDLPFHRWCRCEGLLSRQSESVQVDAARY